MKLKDLHEANYSDYDPSEEGNPEYDAHIQSIISDNYVHVEALAEAGVVPLDPESYTAEQATQEKIEEWFNVMVVNDTADDEYARALQGAQAPVIEYFNRHGNDLVSKEAVNQLAQLSEQLGDRFTISQLAQINSQWVQTAATNTYSHEDIANDPDIGQQYADDKAERDDPYRARGVSRSDFI